MAFGHEPTETSEPLEVVAEVEPKVASRIAEDPNVVRVRAGGPVVELEASLVRGIEPIEPVEPAANGDGPATDEKPAPEKTAETQAWRRTAMAELTALAGDSDDLTPNRRR